LTAFHGGELETHCYDASTGRLIWAKGIKPEQLELFHSTEGSPAAGTPATDGRRVVSYFGSIGLVCYDYAGKQLWKHPLPVALSGGSYGSGTSPAIIGKLVVLNRDQDQGSSLLAVDIASGKTVWETLRPDAIGSFGTPILWQNEGMPEIVMPGSVRLKGYDPKTGKERWTLDGVASFVCTTPVTGNGMLYFAAWSPGKADMPWGNYEAFLKSFDKNHDGVVSLNEIDPITREYMRGLDRDRDGKITEADWKGLEAAAAKAENVMLAVKPGGKGDISATHVAWKTTRGLPYVPSPLFYEGRVYVVRDGGMLSCYDAATGKPFYDRERLAATDSYYASPVAADGRIYVASLAGKLTVVKAGGDKPEILHQADFGERISATPALVANRLYLRTKTRLYAFGENSVASR